MKLATYKDGSRDGQLIVVSRDLATAHYATGIANTLQQVLDDWNFYSPQLQDLYDALNRVGDSGYGASLARHAFPFDPSRCMAPLPRAYQRVSSRAYAKSGIERKSGKAPAPQADAELRLFQVASDELLGPCDPLPCASEAQGIDFAAGLGVITGDVRRGVTPAQALDSIRLLVLVNELSLQQLAAAEQAQGACPVQSRPATALSPVAVTPDELALSGESAWDKGRVHLTLQTTWNGRKVGLCETGEEMSYHFGELIAQLCQTRHARAGTLVGSGPVRNQNLSRGYNSIAEKRAIETLLDGQPMTEFMKFGDTLRIEMKGRDGKSLFGAIAQEVVPLEST